MLIVGGVMMALAYLADHLGYGDTGSFGIGQFLLAIAGLAVLLIGLMGRSFFDLYRDAATIMMNTLVLLAFIELVAIIVGRTSFQIKHTSIQDLPYYAAQDWTKTYWREANLSQSYGYEPYIVWRHLPYSSELINYDHQGLRQTPQSDCSVGAYRVFAFGGSTMLGWGAPDWGTIPAYLQRGFEEYLEGPVCVVNLAEDGYGSTQSLVALTLELQSGNIPDMVIFYDGVNEVIAAYESGLPSAHVSLSLIAARFEEQDPLLVTWVRGTRTYALVERLLFEPKQKGYGLRVETPIDAEGGLVSTASRHLADGVAKVYLGNYRIVEALAKEYGFDYYFFLQPHLAVSGKVLTNEEQTFRSRMDPALADLAREFYGNVAILVDGYEHLWNLAHVLDQEKIQIWFDEVGHITPEGNRLVALEMIAVIRQWPAWK